MEPKRRNRLALVTTVALAGLAIAPATSSAATSVGEIWTPNTPPAGGNCQAGNIYAQTQINNPPAFTVPAGVITSWSTRAFGTGGLRGSLKVVRVNSETSMTVLGGSAIQTLTPNAVNTFAARIPVAAGGVIGYAVPAGSTDQPCFDNGSDNADEVSFGVDPSPGSQVLVDPNLGNPRNQSRLNLAATVEADADRDGFGDETQDQCRGSSGPNNGCPAGAGGGGGGGGGTADTTKPTLGRLSFARSSFAAASSGSAFTTQKKKRKPPVGSKVSFNLSEASSVRFTVERKTTGRRVSGKCKTRTRKNRGKPRCPLYKKVSGSFTVNGKSGRNTITFRGRVGGRKLRTGSYRMTGKATDAARNASTPVKATFRIVK